MPLLAILYLYLPAFIANGAPVIAKNVPGLRSWNAPILRHWLGKNKTWRGLIIGVLVATLTGFTQSLFYPFASVNIAFPMHSSILLSTAFGFTLGLGALLGDIVESYFKRKLNIRPGKPLPVWDGVDYMLGAIILSLPFYMLQGSELILLLLSAPALSMVANTFSYLFGWKNVWY